MCIRDRVNGVEEQVYVAYDEDTAKAYADKAGTEEKSARYILGFMPAVEDASLKNIISEAYYYTIFVVKLVCDALGGLVTGSVGIDQLSGPVGFAAAVDTAVKTQYSLCLLYTSAGSGLSHESAFGLPEGCGKFSCGGKRCNTCDWLKRRAFGGDTRTDSKNRGVY